MELQLKNIGMIKEANVKLDGLTVIAGENDTGKSTAGKAFYVILKSSSDNIESSSDFLVKKIFKTLDIDKARLKGLDQVRKPKDIIFIETPLVWNLQDYFQSSVNIESHLKMVGEEIDIPYPYLMKDLYFKLVSKKSNQISADIYLKKKNIKNNLLNLMNGEFVEDKRTGLFYFHRENKVYDLVNVASGIKYFGLMQVLLDNNRLNKDTVLILDEPEVHLHPKWQLEMAKIIVELVKNDVKVLVNSHSPYMIEALKRYSDKENLQDKTNFYLAEDGYIKQIDNSNSQTLVSIYEKLSEPYDVFEEMESDRFQNG